MKNYIIGILIVFVLFLCSLFYKNNNQSNFECFPIPKSLIAQSEHPILYIFIVFSKDNCSDCLGIIDVLNNLPSNFIVCGIVNKEEMKDENEFRTIIGANFQLKTSFSKLTKFSPNYTPTIIGVGQNGKIYFVLPGVPNEKEYLEKFLNDFYTRAFPLLMTK